jgi:putative ABC transport system substrate-binding protein
MLPFACVVAGLLAACTLVAQPAPRVPHVALLIQGVRVPSPNLDAFRDGLRERGYVDGQNVVLDLRFSGDTREQLAAGASELVHLNPDVIVTGGTVGIEEAKAATSTIPIVMATSGDPVGTGLVASLGRPGGNVTGLTLISPELGGKRLEILKDSVPDLTRVAFLTEPANPASRPLGDELGVAARVLGLDLRTFVANSPEELDGAIAAAQAGGAQALVVFGGTMYINHGARIADLASRYRLPAMYQYGEFVDAGGLMAYGMRMSDLWRRSAYYVDRILKGGHPAEMPIERPMHFTLMLNLKVAQTLDLAIPRSVLEQASEVITN